jgi:hypothetical protein
LAAAFCAGVNFVDVRFGFFLSQNAFPFTTSPYLPNRLQTFYLLQYSFYDVL